MAVKKRIIIFILGLFCFSCLGVLLLSNNKDNEIINNVNDSVLINNNMLTMMYETDYQSGEYQASSESTWLQDGYTFNETLSSCENGSTLTWDDENKRVVMQANTSDRCYVYFDAKEPTFADVCRENDTNTFACYIAKQHISDGDNNLYYHDGIGTYTNASQEAGDNSYRYSGANPDNYVCFGTDELTCPNDNLYRIIGVFNEQLKLIKNESIGNYTWYSTNSNMWNASTKPNLYSVLNTTFYNTLVSEWAEKIATTEWQVGGVSHDNAIFSAIQTAYNYEVGVGQSGYEETMKIGLMYVSDYGYAASPENWMTDLSNYDNTTNTENNWLLPTNDEWTISRSSDSGVYAFYILRSGNVSSGHTAYNQVSFRPVFYLEPSVAYISGDGTQQNPFRIA